MIEKWCGGAKHRKKVCAREHIIFEDNRMGVAPGNEKLVESPLVVTRKVHRSRGWSFPEVWIGAVGG